MFSGSNICRIPIIDYHRHCADCSYDLCLHCCQDLRGPSKDNCQSDNAWEEGSQSRSRLTFSDMYPGWEANSDGSIPCPPKEYGGCRYSLLNLSRIFKMNWIAKLVKNAEEMVSGCKVTTKSTPQQSGANESIHNQFAHREDSDDNFLYCPSSEDIKVDGINSFRKHWSRGEPVIVKEIFDRSSMSSWDPVVLWRGISETSDEKMKDDKRIVKAVDCLNWSEVRFRCCFWNDNGSCQLGFCQFQARMGISHGWVGSVAMDGKFTSCLFIYHCSFMNDRLILNLVSLSKDTQRGEYGKMGHQRC